jgi:hypothetical protein
LLTHLFDPNLKVISKRDTAEREKSFFVLTFFRPEAAENSGPKQGADAADERVAEDERGRGGTDGVVRRGQVGAPEKPAQGTRVLGNARDRRQQRLPVQHHSPDVDGPADAAQTAPDGLSTSLSPCQGPML